MYIKRKISQKLLLLSKSFPVVMVTGARQVGKTTLLKELAESDREFVSLDIMDNRILAIEEPNEFLKKHKPPVIIDEFQYAPGLLPHIKIYVDNHQNRGDFWLTGSQSFVSMKNISESLAGRAGILNLFGLANSEIMETLLDEYTTDFDQLNSRMANALPMGKSETYAKIIKGSMPLLYSNFPAAPQDYFDSYFQTYLTRDIKDLAQVADELSFYKFMQVCGGLTASQTDYTDISKRVGISVNKVKEWISILVSSGIIILLPPYFNNALKRAVKTPKMYFMDTGLLCYLRGINNAEALEKTIDSGNFFENYVVSELYKSFTNVGKRPPLYYYRDANNRKEIDVIIENNGVVYPIEIKESTNPEKKAIKNFDVLEPLQAGTGSVICNCNDIYPIGADVWAVPHWLI